AAAFVYSPLIPLADPLYRLLLWVREASRRKDEDEEPNEEDVRAYLDVGDEEGILEAEEGSLVESVIDFTGTLVREVMTPRTEITAVPEGASLAELIEVVAKSRQSRIPIFRGSIDHILGFVNTRDLFVHWGKDENLRASEMARPVHVVPETKRVSELLREL